MRSVGQSNFGASSRTSRVPGTSRRRRGAPAPNPGAPIALRPDAIGLTSYHALHAERCHAGARSSSASAPAAGTRTRRGASPTGSSPASAIAQAHPRCPPARAPGASCGRDDGCDDARVTWAHASTPRPVRRRSISVAGRRRDHVRTCSAAPRRSARVSGNRACRRRRRSGVIVGGDVEFDSREVRRRRTPEAGVFDVALVLRRRRRRRRLSSPRASGSKDARGLAPHAPHRTRFPAPTLCPVLRLLFRLCARGRARARVAPCAAARLRRQPGPRAKPKDPMREDRRNRRRRRRNRRPGRARRRGGSRARGASRRARA